MKRVWGLLLAATVIPSCSSEDALVEPTCDPAPCSNAPRSPSSETLPDGAPAPPSTLLTLTLEPNQLVVKQGSSIDVNVVITRPSNLIEELAVELANLPPNTEVLTAKIPGDRTRASFRLTFGASTPQGTFAPDVTVRGTSKVVTTRLPLSVLGKAGALDTTFTPTGRATSAVEFSVANFGVQPDGRIVVGGTTGGAAPHDQIAVRFDTSGVADATFGAGGKAVFDYGGDEYVQDVLVQQDGKVVLAGYYYTPEAYSQLIGRFDVDGKPDATFGNAGKISQSPSVFNIFYGLHQQADGKLLAAGIRHNTVDYDCLVARFTAQGVPDPTFGTGGSALLEMGSQDYCFAVATDAQGRVAFTGQRYNGTGYDLTSGRFTAAGLIDATFGAPKGWVNSVPGAALTAFGWDMLVQPDGKTLVAGSGPGPSVSNQDIVLYRYNEDGTADASFGNAGKAAFDIGSYDRVHRVALDSQKRIIIVGSSATDASARAFIGRLLPNGQLDGSFGAGGGVLLDYSSTGVDSAQGVTVLSDDRLLIAGTSLEAGKTTPWVAKLWP